MSALWSNAAPCALQSGDPLAIEHAATRVLIVPDGAVFRVNFAALPDGEGFLVERGWRMHMPESEQDLQAAPVRNMPQMLLAVGSPDFGPSNDLAGATRRDTCAPRFTPLPGTGAEVDRLADIWRKNAHSEPELLKGSAASKSALSAKIAKASVIHIATHSFELGHECSAASTRGVGLAVHAKAVRETPIELDYARWRQRRFLRAGIRAASRPEDAVTMSLDRATGRARRVRHGPGYCGQRRRCLRSEARVSSRRSPHHRDEFMEGR